MLLIKLEVEASGKCSYLLGLVEDLPHKVHIYSEYHCVCPLVGIGTLPSPLSPTSVPLPPKTGWGLGHTLLLVRGWGSPNSND
jgi:hypothetical protein